MPISNEQKNVLKNYLKAVQITKEGRKLLWGKDYFAWVKDNWTSRGNPLDFDKHKYLVAIYQDQHDDIVYRKSAQTGLTERMLTEALWLPDQYKENSIYFFPTSSTIADMVQERVDDPINNSSYLSIVSGRAKKIMGKQADKVGLKRMSNGFVYFRGSNTPTQITSVAGDAIFIDEIDRMDPNSVSYFDKRLEHSDRKWKRTASTPTIPGYGVDKEYKTTDQHQYHIRCNHCNALQALDFWRNVEFDHRKKENDEYEISNQRIFCSHCKKTIIPWQLEGEWIDRYGNPWFKGKNIGRRGFQISQLYSPRLILEKLAKSSLLQSEFDIQQFYNQNLGLPYEPKGTKLTEEDINNCMGSHTAPKQVNEDYVYMGVDVGKYLHWVCRTKKMIVGFGTVPNFTGENSLEQVVANFKVRGTVIDAMPETRKASEFARKFRGRVKINYYTGMAEMKDVKKYWKVDGDKVNSSRTVGLDNVFAEIKMKEIILPVNLSIDFKSHLKSTVRVIEEGKSGEIKVFYMEVSDDHFLHGCNYAKLAVNIFNVATPEVFVL